jgi:hypothetical protein
MLIEEFIIQLSDYEEVQGMLKGDCMWQAVEIVMVGITTVFEICFMCLIMSLSRILFQDTILMNLFDPMRHQEDCRKVKSSIYIRKMHFSHWKPT